MKTHIINVGNDGPAAAVDKTFANFLRSAAGQAACGGELITRLMPSANTISSLPALLRWSRERHPTMFPPQDWRNPLSVSSAPFGSAAMKDIWAKYLAWKEAT